MFTYKPEGAKVPIKVWMDKIAYHNDEGMVEQLENVSKLPFMFRHVALSPDGHLGYGVPIGGVGATDGVIIPNFVGVDIGCGMQFAKTTFDAKDLSVDVLKQIMSDIRRAIPVGKSRHTKPQDLSHMPQEIPALDSHFVCYREFDNACKQVGTLGGGNHFIEVQEIDDGKLGVMLHSGSRNLGKQVADHYIKVAKDLNKKWHSVVQEDLAFLPLGTEEGQAYLREMNYALEFAKCNRTLMMNRVRQIFYNRLANFNFEDTIEIHHNFARMEHHYGRNVMVHRKGATSAKDGELGIIPGSQGSASYIVKGKGNPESFMSCSHGAGRTMGRNQARQNLDLAEEVRKLDEKGVVHSIRTEKDLDEAPSAYKDISIVMKEQEDLVDIVHELKPMGVIKA